MFGWKTMVATVAAGLVTAGAQAAVINLAPSAVLTNPNTGLPASGAAKLVDGDLTTPAWGAGGTSGSIMLTWPEAVSINEIKTFASGLSVGYAAPNQMRVLAYNPATSTLGNFNTYDQLYWSTTQNVAFSPAYEPTTQIVLSYWNTASGAWIQLDEIEVMGWAVVPEPAALSFLGLGALAMVRRRK